MKKVIQNGDEFRIIPKEFFYDHSHNEFTALYAYFRFYS